MSIPRTERAAGCSANLPPNDDSVLFRSGQDYHFNACLSDPSWNYELYANGYRRAAERLFASVQEDQSGLDSIIYPTVFLYRHWLELRLKRIIDEGKQLLQAGRGYPEHHKLHSLWGDAKKILRQVWKGEPPEYKLIGNVVKDFEIFDSESQSFRYPINKAGENNLEGLRHINIRHFVETMAQVADFLDGASSGISQYLSDCREA